MKRVIIITCAIMVLLVTARFIIYPFIEFRYTKDVEKTLGVDFSMVDKVRIRYGGSGVSFDIKEKRNVQEFFDMFKGVKLKQKGVIGAYTGFVFDVTMYKSDKIIGGFDFTHDSIVENKSYDKHIIYTSSKTFNVNEIVNKYHLK